MPTVRRPPAARRTVFRLLATLAAAAQVSVSAFGPIVDGLGGEGAPSHVEAFGIRLHYSHNPDDCAACIAASLVAALPPSGLGVIPAVVRVLRVASRAIAPAAPGLPTPKAPRAPPRPVMRAL